MSVYSHELTRHTLSLWQRKWALRDKLRLLNMQTYSVMAQFFFFSPRRVFLSQSRPILISCQSPTLLIKSKLLFLFVASNLCEHTRIYHQSAVAALKVKITAEFFFFSFFFLSWISCLIFIDGGFHLKSVSQSNSWRVESFSNLGHPADTLKRSQHLMYSVTLSR